MAEAPTHLATCCGSDVPTLIDTKPRPRGSPLARLARGRLAHKGRVGLLCGLVLVTGAPGYAAEPETSPAASSAAATAAPSPSAASASPVAPVGHGPGAADGATGPVPYGYPPAFFAQLWQRRQLAMAQGNDAGATDVLRQILNAKHRAGWPDLPVLGEALAWESRQAGATGDWRRALELATDALALAPHRVSPHRALAAARWGTGDVTGSFASLAVALSLLLSEPPLIKAGLGSLGLMSLFATLGACVALVMAGLYRHFASLTHHVTQHLLPPGATPLQAAAMLAAVLLLPAMLRFGAVWLCLLWLAILGPFFERAERWGALLALALLGAMAALMPTIMEPIAYAGSRQDLMYQAIRDVDADVSTLGQSQGTPQEAYILGLRARWSGDGRQAVLFLQQAMAQGLKNPELLVSLGNAWLLLGNPTAAVQAYEQALSADPRHVLALFNLSQVYFSVADPRASKVRHQADESNIKAVAKLAAYAQMTGLSVVEPEVPRSLLSIDSEPDLEHSRAVEQMWRWFGGPTPRQALFPGVFLLLSWLGMLARGSRAKRCPHACPRCGEPACPRCHPALPNALCADCHLALDSHGPQQLRIKKEIDSHRYHARVQGTQRLVNLVVAGGGQLLRGEFVRGLVFMVVFFTIALGLLTGFDLLPDVMPAYGTNVGVFRVGGGLLLVALYLLAVLDGQRDRT